MMPGTKNRRITPRIQNQDRGCVMNRSLVVVMKGRSVVQSHMADVARSFAAFEDDAVNLEIIERPR